MIQNGTAAFGDQAVRWAQRLPADLPAVVVDPTALIDGYAAALARRESGATFFIATHVTDSRAELALTVAGATASETYDQRRVLLDQLTLGALLINGRPVRELRVHDDATIATLRDLHLLGDAVLVRSPAEYERQVELIGRRRRHVAFYASPASGYPSKPSTRDGTLVVWAPHLPWERLTLYATAVEEMRRPAVIVAATLPPRATPVRFATAEEGRAELERAIAVIDAEFYDPAIALALRALDVPLAAASTTGIQSYLDDAGIYAPWDWRSIQGVAYGALGRSAPRLRRHGYDEASLRVTLSAAAPPRIEDGPLVTYIIPTYNRLDGLETTLRCLAAQTYKNIECIVVNDAGSPVEDVVAPFPQARVVNLETNTGGAIVPINVGATHARGKYVGLLADDDVNYPDHVARLVDVLERTGLPVAHGNIGVRFLERTQAATGSQILDSTVYRTYGYNASRGMAHLDPQANLVMGRVSLQAMLIRRDLFEELGYVSLEFAAIADHELLMRLSRLTDWVHSDHITCEWCRRSDASNYCVQLPPNWQAIYPALWRLHPFEDRPSLQRARQEMLLGITGQAVLPEELRCEPTIRFPAGESIELAR